MKRRPPRSTRTDPLFPYTTLFRHVRPVQGRASRNPLVPTGSRSGLSERWRSLPLRLPVSGEQEGRRAAAATARVVDREAARKPPPGRQGSIEGEARADREGACQLQRAEVELIGVADIVEPVIILLLRLGQVGRIERSEEHTSELQSLMR